MGWIGQLWRAVFGQRRPAPETPASETPAQAGKRRVEALRRQDQRPRQESAGQVRRQPGPDEVLEYDASGQIYEVVPNTYRPPEPDIPRPDLRILQALFHLPGPGADRLRMCGLTKHQGTAYALVQLRESDQWWRDRPLRVWQKMRFTEGVVLSVQRMDGHTLCVQDPPKGTGAGHWRIG